VFASGFAAVVRQFVKQSLGRRRMLMPTGTVVREQPCARVLSPRSQVRHALKVSGYQNQRRWEPRKEGGRSSNVRDESDLGKPSQEVVVKSGAADGLLIFICTAQRGFCPRAPRLLVVDLRERSMSKSANPTSGLVDLG
jgi:hypothetical protein